MQTRGEVVKNPEIFADVLYVWPQTSNIRIDEERPWANMFCLRRYVLYSDISHQMIPLSFPRFYLDLDIDTAHSQEEWM